MTDTTRVAILHAAHDLRIETQPLAGPGPGEVMVKVGRGGICGSDLHYFHDGGFGTIRVREPIILGHEVAGTIEALGAGVSGLAIGQKVALNPSHPCGQCRYCREGEAQHCLDMRFFGSAMRMPHVQGAFRERIVVGAPQCVQVSAECSLAEAAMAEPLAVVLHALNQADRVAGRRVLVTGCGPIGALAILALSAAEAGEIVVTDIVDEPLERARALGASRTVNVATEPDGLKADEADKGRFDLVFECSGNPRALAQALAVTRPRGSIVQVGVGGTFDVPMNVVVAKEIALRGSFRFHHEFAQAAEAVSSRRIDVRELITATRPLADAVAAFELATDRRKSIKVQLELG